MELLVFGLGMGAGVALLAAYVGSYLWPAHRIWPPGERDWRFWFHWTADGLYFVCLFALVYLDWWSLGRPELPILVAGGGLFVVGALITLAVELELGSDETLGMEGELATDGPYRYSRNPQYVGLFAATFGVIVLAWSTLVAVLGGLRLVTWLVLPFPEETWLRSVYGAEYEGYCEEVPRFVGYRSVERLLSVVSGTRGEPDD